MNSVGSQFARAVKVWLRDKAPLSFTHRALVRFGQTVLTFNIEVCMYLCVCVCVCVRAHMVGLDETTKEIKHLEAISTFSPVGS